MRTLQNNEVEQVAGGLHHVGVFTNMVNCAGLGTLAGGVVYLADRLSQTPPQFTLTQTLGWSAGLSAGFGLLQVAASYVDGLLATSSKEGRDIQIAAARV